MPDKLPVVLSREEIGRLIRHVDGTMWLIVALLYGTGLRLEECVELRVKDLDFDRNQIASAPFVWRMLSARRRWLAAAAAANPAAAVNHDHRPMGRAVLTCAVPDTSE